MKRLVRAVRGRLSNRAPRAALPPVGPTFLLARTGRYRVAERCPDCGGTVAYDLGCHTWGGNPDGTGWRYCMPCGSAYEFNCVGADGDDDEGCGWSYTWGLNPGNPRSVGNEKGRPSWIAQGSRPDL